MIGRLRRPVAVMYVALTLAVLVWPSPATAASIPLPSSADANCDAGTLEAMPSALFADGAVYIELRCYLNNTSPDWGAMVTGVTTGAGAALGPSAPINTALNGSASPCSTVTGKTVTFGPLVSSTGTVVHAGTGDAMPQNYVVMGGTCTFTPHGTIYGGLCVWGGGIGSGVSFNSGTPPGNTVVWPTSANCNARANPNGTTYDGALGVRDLTDAGETTAFLDFTSNPDWFGTYVGPLQGPCRDNVEFFYSLNGEDIDLVESMDTNVLAADQLVLGVSIAGGMYPTPLSASSFAWRPRPGVPWAVAGTPAAVVPVLDTTLLSFNVDEGAGFPLNLAELRCTDAEGVHYLDAGNNWDGTPRADRPCDSISAKLPAGNVETGGTVSSRYSLMSETTFTGGDVWVDLTYRIRQDETWYEVEDVTSWSVYGAQLGGLSPFAGELRVDAPKSGDIRFTMVSGGDPARGQLWCTDSSGETRLWGDGTPTEGSWQVTPGADDSCYDGSGMSLSPASWPMGFARMSTCLAQSFVVPDDEALAERLDTFNSLMAEPPLQWIAQGSDYVSDAEFTFGRWSEVGPACTTVLDQEVCPRTWDTAALPSWFLAVFGFGLWSLVVFAVWRFF